MSNHLTLFEQPKLMTPDYMADLFGEEGNIQERQSVPSLSYEGKVWTIAMNGEKTKLMKRDADGDEAPVAVMRVVVLDYGKRRGRAYYEGSYDPANPGSPLCWSDDGVAPHPSVSEPKCDKCETCPMAVKGSKVTEQGKAVQACSQHRMLAVVPANKLDFTPLRLKIAITSDYDKQSPELEAQGWFAFSNYTDFLRSKGVDHTAKLVTKMRFDPNVAYPKVMFSPDRWLERDEALQVAPLTKSEDVKSLLGGTYTPAGVDGKPVAPLADDEVDIAQVNAAAKKAAAAKPAAEKPKPAAPAPVSQVLDDDDDMPDLGAVLSGGSSEPEKPKAAAKAPKAEKPAPAAAAAEVPDDVAALLNDWDD